MNGPEIMETMSQLKKLTLKQLSRLARIWTKNSHQVLVFQNLQEVIVDGCENLQTLFPASLARNLEKLEKLEIELCDKLQEIVQKEESTEADTPEKFVFPCLETLHLYYLPHLTCFYPQSFSLECPSLSSLYVRECHKLELFQSAHPMGEGEGGSTSINRQPLISDLKVISKLKELILNWKHIWALALRFRSGEFPEGLKYLENIILFFDADENEKAMFPIEIHENEKAMFSIEILQKAPNLTEMCISYCNASMILLAQNPKIVEESMLGQLKELTLWNVFSLQSMDSEDSSWLNSICRKLKELNIVECPDLTKLVHRDTVSFSCPKKVSILNCPQLQYLFTSSAAKKLMNLEEIQVNECESVKEIVANDSKELHVDKCPDLTTLVHKDTASFSCLKKVSMSNCPQLQYLFTSSAAKKLMNLEEIEVNECESVKEIVANDSKLVDEDKHKGEGDDKHENEMIFGKLKFLKLNTLPKFESFYMGSFILNFLSLKEVWFNQCHSVKVFRLHDKLPVDMKVAIDGYYREGDIHSLIMQQPEEEAA